MSRRNRRSVDREYRTPWLLKEISGAPVWAMIAFGVIVAGIASFALLHR